MVLLHETDISHELLKGAVLPSETSNKISNQQRVVADVRLASTKPSLSHSNIINTIKDITSFVIFSPDYYEVLPDIPAGEETFPGGDSQGGSNTAASNPLER